jgi:hypothetical protein
MIKHISSLISFTEFLKELVNSNGTEFSIYFDNEKSCVSISGEIEIVYNTVKITDIIYQYESHTSYSQEISRSKEYDFAIFDINTGKMIKDCYLDDKYCDGADGHLSEFLPMFFNDV